MNKDQYVMMARREIATMHALEWLNDPEQAVLVEVVRGGKFADPDEGVRQAAGLIRGSAICALTPKGGFPLPPGSRLRLLCRVIEAGMDAIDWEAVAEHVLSDAPKDED